VNEAGVTRIVLCYICFAQVVMGHAYALLVDVNMMGAYSTSRAADSVMQQLPNFLLVTQQN
jgi:hypothetical protein